MSSVNLPPKDPLRDTRFAPLFEKPDPAEDESKEPPTGLGDDFPDDDYDDEDEDDDFGGGEE